MSRRAPRVVRRSREAAALPCSMPMPPVLTGRPMAHPVDSPPSPRRARGAIRADGVHLPMRSAILAHPGIAWHLGVNGHKLCPPRPCRIPAGCLVSQSDRNGSQPTATIGRPPKRRQNTPGTKAAPAPRVYQLFISLDTAGRKADLAPRHYRISAAPGGAPDVVTGRKLHRLAAAAHPIARCPPDLAAAATPPCG